MSSNLYCLNHSCYAWSMLLYFCWLWKQHTMAFPPQIPNLTPPSFNIAPEKMMAGRWVSFWDCLFFGAMLNFRGVTESSNQRKATPLVRSRNALVWPGTGHNRRLAGFEASRSRLWHAGFTVLLPSGEKVKTSWNQENLTQMLVNMKSPQKCYLMIFHYIYILKLIANFPAISIYIYIYIYIYIWLMIFHTRFPDDQFRQTRLGQSKAVEPRWRESCLATWTAAVGWWLWGAFGFDRGFPCQILVFVGFWRK